MGQNISFLSAHHHNENSGLINVTINNVFITYTLKLWLLREKKAISCIIYVLLRE